MLTGDDENLIAFQEYSEAAALTVFQGADLYYTKGMMWALYLGIRDRDWRPGVLAAVSQIKFVGPALIAALVSYREYNDFDKLSWDQHMQNAVGLYASLLGLGLQLATEPQRPVAMDQPIVESGERAMRSIGELLRETADTLGVSYTPGKSFLIRRRWTDGGKEFAEIELGSVGSHKGRPDGAMAPETRTIEVETVRLHVDDPTNPATGEEAFFLKDGTRIVPIGSAQTMVPGSVHDETEEVIEFDDSCYGPQNIPIPAEANSTALVRITVLIAIGTVLVRNWTEGNRHGLALHAAGFLAKHGYSDDEVARLFSAVAEFCAVSVKELALGLPKRAWRRIEWREGAAERLSSRFARVRVRVAHRDYNLTEGRPEEWLLIEWPKGEDAPSKYWLSTLPQDITFRSLVDMTKLRWRIERDYQELKQEVGLGHFEGRGWRGFHHHATMCIPTYGFLVSERETWH